MILSAYAARKKVEELFSPAPELHYHNITPGKLTYPRPDNNSGPSMVLLPAWRIVISKDSINEAEDKIFFLTVYGDIIFSAQGLEFSPITVGTVFRHKETNIMLEQCDKQNHQSFIPEPQIAIGIKKGPIYWVQE